MGNCLTNDYISTNLVSCSICKNEINNIFDICYSCSVCSKNHHHACLEKKNLKRDKCYSLAIKI